MEKPAGKVEFLCLRCGLQGLCELQLSEECGVLCPKCGQHVITAHLLQMEKEQLQLAIV